MRAQILLVEDNKGDAELVERAFLKVRPQYQIVTAADGVEAIELVSGRNWGAPMRPRLILLDLNLPRMDGHEVLLRLKQDERFRPIPVIVLTNSTAPDDIRRCYGDHANAYIRKPATWDELLTMVGVLASFWLDMAEAPAGN